MGVRTRRRRDGDQLIDPRRFVAAISHPVRVEILVECTRAPISPSEFTEQRGGSLSRNSHHFRKLLEYKMIREVDSRPVRGSTEHFYVATYRALFSEEAFGQVPAAVRESVSATVLTTFMERAEEALLANTLDSHDGRHLTWQPLELDQDGFEAVMTKLDEIFEWLPVEQMAARRRMKESGESPMDVTIGMFGFESPPPDRDHELRPGDP